MRITSRERVLEKPDLLLPLDRSKDKGGTLNGEAVLSGIEQCQYIHRCATGRVWRQAIVEISPHNQGSTEGFNLTR